MSDYLPAELISKILTRLPVDTLLRCTTVCKSWYHLITSPSFISSHCKLSNPNQEPRLLLSYRTHCCVHRDNQTFDKIVQLFFPTALDYQVVGSFNGLFCLADYRLENVMLWNPSLRKSLILPNPRVLPDTYSHRPGSIGFGFLPTTNDYKIVRILCHAERVPLVVDIYELSVGSWRNINSEDFPYVTMCHSPPAFLNGIVHWVGYNQYKFGGTTYRLIVSFDMKNEKFGVLMFPSCWKYNLLFELHIFKESLCLIQYSGNLCSIWVMKEYGVTDSWEKQFNIDIGVNGISRPFYFRENGDLLFFKEIENSDDNSHSLDSLVSYDLTKKEVKDVGVRECAHMFSYVESLVLIKGSNEVLGRLDQH